MWSLPPVRRLGFRVPGPGRGPGGARRASPRPPGWSGSRGVGVYLCLPGDLAFRRWPRGRLGSLWSPSNGNRCFSVAVGGGAEEPGRRPGAPVPPPSSLRRGRGAGRPGAPGANRLRDPWPRRDVCEEKGPFGARAADGEPAPAQPPAEARGRCPRPEPGPARCCRMPREPVERSVSGGTEPLARSWRALLGQALKGRRGEPAGPGVGRRWHREGPAFRLPLWPSPSPFVDELQRELTLLLLGLQ